MYAPETPERETYWSPGQILPTTSATLTQPLDYGQSDLKTMIQKMHSSIESNFTDVKSHLAELEGRVANIEEKQKQLELQHSPTSSSSSSESSGTGRKRKSPSELQVIR